MIIHCGGCMLNEREMKYRLKCADDADIPITKLWHCDCIHEGNSGTEYRDIPTITKINERFIYKGDFYADQKSDNE